MSGGALPLDAIRTDGGTQPRTGLNEEVVQAYAEAWGEGADFPPLVIFHDGADYWLADGFHRLFGAKAAGRAVVDCDIRQGTRRDAILFAAGANATHGLRRSNADKRRAVLLLLEDADWARWSDREIARRCAVSKTFVSNVRGELSGNGCQIEGSTRETETRTVERGGVTYEMTLPRVSANAVRHEARKERVAAPPPLGEGERLGAKSGFVVNKTNFYRTPRKAVEPLLALLPKRLRFFEPCAGDGALVRHLERAGHECLGAIDIEPQDISVGEGDARQLTHDSLPDDLDCFITNPPWDRAMLHPLIEHLGSLAPTFLLFDADWMHTKAAAPLIAEYCTDIVSVGRVRWFEDSSHDGMNNAAWYRFDAAKAPGWPAFIPRQSKQESGDG